MCDWDLCVSARGASMGPAPGQRCRLRRSPAALAARAAEMSPNQSSRRPRGTSKAIMRTRVTLEIGIARFPGLDLVCASSVVTPSDPALSRDPLANRRNRTPGSRVPRLVWATTA